MAETLLDPRANVEQLLACTCSLALSLGPKPSYQASFTASRSGRFCLEEGLAENRGPARGTWHMVATLLGSCWDQVFSEALRATIAAAPQPSQEGPRFWQAGQL